MRLLIKEVRFINPYRSFDDQVDVLIVDGKIHRLADHLSDPKARVINGKNKILSPGFIDMHVHLREPGQTHKETIYTGMQAAAHGGFTAVACMPNTRPALDSVETLELVREKAQAGPVHVLPIGAMTLGLKGKTLTDMAALKKAGAVAFSDDGMALMDSGLMAQAMAQAKSLDRVVIDHCEDLTIDTSGVMNRGKVSEELGLKGIPRAAEDIMTARDLLLAKEYDLPIHIAHVSTQTSLEMIARAKEEGVDVTAEVTPHHFTLTDEALGSLDPVYKVSPPLRTKADREALIRGLREGQLDMIATDHAPHQKDEKARGLKEAPKGMTGLETCLGLVITELVVPGHITMARAVEMLTLAPHRRFSLAAHLGDPQEGLANLTLFDPFETYEVKEEDFYSKSSNSPYLGRTLQGRVLMTLAGGQLALDQGKVTF